MVVQNRDVIVGKRTPVWSNGVDYVIGQTIYEALNVKKDDIECVPYKRVYDVYPTRKRPVIDFNGRPIPSSGLIEKIAKLDSRGYHDIIYDGRLYRVCILFVNPTRVILA